jgi:hypothetical protein
VASADEIRLEAQSEVGVLIVSVAQEDSHGLL